MINKTKQKRLTKRKIGSVNAAYVSCGLVLQAVDDVHEGKIINALCAVRPPGHHAEKEVSCLFV